jgi:hypothetical protein
VDDAQGADETTGQASDAEDAIPDVNADKETETVPARGTGDDSDGEVSTFEELPEPEVIIGGTADDVDADAVLPEEEGCDIFEVCDRIAAGLQSRQQEAPRELRFLFDPRKAKAGMRWWLTEKLTESDYAFLGRQSLLELWDHLGHEHRRLEDFSKVAIYVLSIPASSAAIERHIWRQRRALCPDRMRTSLRTEENRPRLAACRDVLGLDLPWQVE